ncbi:hypothetical protein LXL04_030048 [Taraxacum kok-saghyz]
MSKCTHNPSVKKQLSEKKLVHWMLQVFVHNLRFEAYVGDIIPYALELVQCVYINCQISIQLLIVKSIYKVFCKFSF